MCPWPVSQLWEYQTEGIDWAEPADQEEPKQQYPKKIFYVPERKL